MLGFPTETTETDFFNKMLRPNRLEFSTTEMRCAPERLGRPTRRDAEASSSSTSTSPGNFCIREPVRNAWRSLNYRAGSGSGVGI